MEPKLSTTDLAKYLDISLQALHKKLKTKNIVPLKSSSKTYLRFQESRKLINFPFQSQIISFQIVKGGTGKTTIAHSIAIRANLYGARVLCIDLDQQGNLTQSFKINANHAPVMVDLIQNKIPFSEAIVPVYEGLDLLPSRIENAVLDNLLVLNRLPLDQVFFNPFSLFKQKYDLIVIDCPPALSQTVAAVTMASDLVIAPVVPEEFSLSGLNVTIKEINEMAINYRKEIPFKLVVNRFDSRTSLSHEILSQLIKSKDYSEKIFKTYIRTSQEFPNAIAQGVSIFDVMKSTSAKEDIDLLAKEILGLHSQRDLPLSL
jgi:chromosome partitioning protein